MIATLFPSCSIVRFSAATLVLTSVSLLAQTPEKAPAAPEAEKTATEKKQYKVHAMDRPRPRVVTPPVISTPETPGKAPSDAKVIFDGTDLSQWKRRLKKDETNPENDKAEWKVENGYFEVVPGKGFIDTRESFAGDVQWHIEWCTPAEVKGNGQGRGNSGVFLGGYPEVQVLDSYQNDTYPDGQAGALYKVAPPMVNACRPPGEWQTYDIILEREKKDAQGQVTRKGRISVIQNGVIVQWQKEVGKDESGGLSLQDHGNPVWYRSIKIRPLP